MQQTDKLRVAVITDNGVLKQWQIDALHGVSDLIDISFVVDAAGSVKPVRLVRYLLYYLLNVVSIRSSLTRKRPYVAQCERIACVTTKSEVRKGWEEIPDFIYRRARDRNIDCFIKFGVGLLVISEDSIPILSFHHGDPSLYRGRPAGFYELLSGKKIGIGVCVQILSNKLDGGRILALGHSKMVTHSYRATCKNFYRLSAPVLRRALVNFTLGTGEKVSTSGTNYRLPTNIAVMKFLCKLSSRKAKRIFSAFLLRKKWEVVEGRGKLSLLGPQVIKHDALSLLETPPGFSFLADPFYLTSGDIACEAAGLISERGSLLIYDADKKKVKRIIEIGGHASFPSPVFHENKQYLMPEVAAFSGPFLLSLDDTDRRLVLRDCESQRMVDPVLFEHQGCWYLFHTMPNQPEVLRLKVAAEPVGPYEEHPSSPVCCDIRGARMGGSLIEREGAVYRVGQDNRGLYGDGIVIFVVSDLSPHCYSECEVGDIRFDGKHGPHTLNFDR